MNAQTIPYQNQKTIETLELMVMSNPIQEMILSIGIPPNIYGFSYITYALELLLIDEDYKHNVTKGLYVDIAKKYHSTPSRVERAIRHAINVAWLHGNMEIIDYIFRNCVRADKDVPSNSVFLSRLFYYIKDASGK